MPARITLAEALTRTTSLQALRGHSLRALSRAKREAIAPKPPNAAQLRYLRVMRAYVRAVERLTREILLPALPPEPERQDSDNLSITSGQDAQADSRFDASSLDDAFDELNAELLGLADRMAPAMAEVGRAVTTHANRQVGRMLNIDLRGGEAKLEPYVAEFVDRNVRLVKSVSFDQLARLREIVDKHQAAGSGVRPLREELMDAFGLTRQRATLIARDQVLKAAAQTNELRQKQVGVQQYVWVASRDERVRDGHAALDGQVVDWAAPPVVEPRTGRRAHAGQDIQCRCVAVAVTAGLLNE